MASQSNTKSVHDFTVKVCCCFNLFCLQIDDSSYLLNQNDYVCLQDARGNNVNLADYKGKVLLIVNVASQWYLYNILSNKLNALCTFALNLVFLPYSSYFDVQYLMQRLD